MKNKKILIPVLVLLIVVGGIIIFKLTNTVDSTGKMNGVEYEISENSFDEEYHIAESGYYVKELDDGTYSYVIFMGEKGTGGYNIKITDVKIDKDLNAKIKVKETSPSEKDIVTMAFTYPATSLKVNKKLKTVTITNTKGKEYKELFEKDK